MSKFTETLKLYYFKDRQEVDLSIRVTDTLAHGYRFTKEEFDDIVFNWETGIDKETSQGFVCIEYKKFGPRPKQEVDPYVKFSVSKNEIRNHHRITYYEMSQMCTEYNLQLNSEMYWDK